jgi:hypothetical protein
MATVVLMSIILITPIGGFYLRRLINASYTEILLKTYNNLFIPIYCYKLGFYFYLGLEFLFIFQN